MVETTLGSIVPIIVASLRSYGVEPQPLLDRAGISARSLQQADARISSNDSKHLLQLAIQATGDYSFGLTMKKHIDINAFQTLGLAASMSNSLLHGIEKIVCYHQVISTALTITLNQCGDEYHITYASASADHRLSHVAYDFSLSAFISFIQARTNGHYRPKRAAISHTPPAHLLARYKHYLSNDLIIGSPTNYLVLDKAEVDKELFPIASSMMQPTEEMLKTQLEKVVRLPLQQVIRNHIQETLSHGEPDPEKTASHVNMSYRTMQRRLAEENTTYRNILDETRKSLATDLVTTKKMPLIEVAFLLGFSDASSFSRSFKRWTGTTPARYRQDFQSTRPSYVGEIAHSP
ncbi:hypothetical protein A9Q99_19275 [Gammaproteobacteria bacterium 45_16_T64]|nr:hypothetical protein A9Q99_19275 [Gammaproteobacteria bacterium 45_16_T64]